MNVMVNVGGLTQVRKESRQKIRPKLGPSLYIAETLANLPDSKTEVRSNSVQYMQSTDMHITMHVIVPRQG